MAVEMARRCFDVDEYHRMVQAGILGPKERVELIGGEVVRRPSIGPRHNAAVDRANRALVTATGTRAIVRVQGSIQLDRFHQPEPDVVLLRPVEDFYASHLPRPADVLLIVEIAESSLAYDRDVKTGVYASAGIPEYWLVDLDTRSIHRFTGPRQGRYENATQIAADGTVAPQAFSACTISARDLLD